MRNKLKSLPLSFVSCRLLAVFAPETFAVVVALNFELVALTVRLLAAGPFAGAPLSVFQGCLAPMKFLGKRLRVSLQNVSARLRNI